MTRGISRKIGLRHTLPWLAILAVVLSASSGAVGSSARRAFGHVHSAWIARSRHLGRHAGTDRIGLAISLGQRDEAGLADLLKGLYDPADPRFHKFLSTAEYRARFAPSDADVAAVQQFFRDRGFEIREVGGTNQLVNVVGRAADIESALQVELHDYQTPDGREVYGVTSEPLLTGVLSAKVKGVAGLSSFIKLRHPRITKRAVGRARPMTTVYYMTPSRLRNAYGMTTASGFGQSIAMFELDGYTTSDISTYTSQFGLSTPTLTNVFVSDGSTTPTGAAGADADEVTLDIEVAIAMAKTLSKIYVYEAPNSSQGILNNYAKIANDFATNGVNQVSTSWGLDEGSAGSAFMTMEATTFQQMATQGQSVFAAAGDSGAYDDGSTLSVDDPASQLNVTGVGGTSITIDSSGNYGTESTWADSTSSPAEGGGGGISSQWALPSWQTGLSTIANEGSATQRMVPDVSLDADPNTGYIIYLTDQSQGAGFYVVGGTSAAAPVWSAFAAIVNHGRASTTAGLLGNINSAVSTIAQSSFYSTAFHDIADNSTNLHYPAVTGYDLATGWGTFKGAGLYAALTLAAAPSSLTLASTATALNLTWPAVTSATSYKVYTSAASTGPFAATATVATNSYSTASTTLLYYYVTAVNFTGEGSASATSFGFANEPVPGIPGSLSATVFK